MNLPTTHLQAEPGANSAGRAAGAQFNPSWLATRQYGGYLLAGILIVAGIVFQIWLLRTHWINPDEGAHLMDSRLAWEGLIPQLDFDARQPLYTYSYVPAFQLWGPSIWSGRVVPLLATWLGAGLVFLIGRRLWDSTRGSVAALVFFVAPTILVNAPVVKMEPMAILVTATGFYALLRHLERGSALWVLISGIAFGAGYYVRESTLAGLLAVTLLLAWHARPWKTLLTRVLILYAGVAVVCLGVLMFYAQYRPWSELIVHESLFPGSKVWHAFSGLLPSEDPALIPGSHPVPEILHGLRNSSQAPANTLVHFLGAVRMNAPLVIAAVMAVAHVGCRVFRRRANGGLRCDVDLSAVLLALFWLGAFGVLYGYWAIKRGFFQFYFRELIPPMTLLFSWSICGALERVGQLRYALAWVAGVIVVLALFFFVIPGVYSFGIAASLLLVALAGWWIARDALPTRARGGIFALFATLVLAGVALLSLNEEWTAMQRPSEWVIVVGAFVVVAALLWRIFPLPGTQRHVAFLRIAVLTGAAAGVGAYGGVRLGPSFDCVWPMETLARVEELIRANTIPGDEVLSGAVIWEFQAGRLPFARLTHPLSLRDSLSRPVPPELLQRLEKDPPRLIVVDGFTEKTYLRRIPELQDLIDSQFSLIENVPGPLYPVSVFGRTSSLTK